MGDFFVEIFKSRIKTKNTFLPPFKKVFLANRICRFIAFGDYGFVLEKCYNKNATQDYKSGFFYLNAQIAVPQQVKFALSCVAVERLFELRRVKYGKIYLIRP